MGLEVNKVKYNSEWPLVRLKEICYRISDGTHFTPAYVKSGIPFISVKDIYNDIVHFDKCKYITKDAHQELIRRCQPEKDDILITKSGTIGRMALVPPKPEFSLFVSVALIKNKKELIHSKFLKFCLENFLNSINISQDIKGGLLKNFHLEDIRETLIPVVALKEQDEIISKLEELFSELDKSIENLRVAQQQLKTYRQSVLKWAFDGKLTNENVKEGELPEGWKNVSITELAEKNKHALKAGPFGSSLKKEFYVEKGYKIYGQEQVISGDAFYGDYYVNEEKYQELSSCKIKSFDILISLVGTVGKVLLLPENCEAGIINPRLIKISLSKNIYLPKFFKYYFESSAVKSFYGAETRGTTMDVLNLGIIKTIPFPLCSIDEQNKIIDAIESRLSVADKMEESISQSLQQAQALRQSILKKAFEGRLL
jgi:type I restriction enzyme, S subunit